MFARRQIMAGGFAALATGTFTRSSFASPSNSPSRSPRLGFGWLRDRPDPADRLFGAMPFAISPAPSRSATVDLSGDLPPAYNQGTLNSCSACAIAGAVQFARRAHGKPIDFVPSQLFIYYQERKTEGHLYVDIGAGLRSGIDAVAKVGVCAESDWKFDGIAGDPVTQVFPQGARAIQTPPASVLAKASQFITISKTQLTAPSEDTLESCLAGGYPFAFGFTVFSNFQPSTTLLTLPGDADSMTQEGHAVLAVGYDRNRRVFRIRNSWGPAHNQNGHFDMAYDYVLNPDLCSDFWVIYQTLAVT